MRKIQQYNLQDVSLWPNTFSFDENRDIQDKRIKSIIDNAKSQFFQKNPTLFNELNFEEYLDSSRDIYYPPKFNQPCYIRAGFHYSIPDAVVGIGLKLKQQFSNDQWAMLYHGTKGRHITSIMKTGALIPGQGQAHNGTIDPYGAKIPKGVYFSFWVNQSYTYTQPNNPIILQCFVKDIYIAPGAKGYVVSNSSFFSRILIPLKKDRSNQLI